MKIVVLDACINGSLDILNFEPLRQYGELTIYEMTKNEEVEQRIQDADCVFTCRALISRTIMEHCPNLKYIGVLATGYNVVDVIAAKEHNILVSNVPSYSTDSVAEFTLAMMLEICHHIGAHSDSVKNGEWTREKGLCYWNYPLFDLKNKTLGLIGFGAIAQKVAKLATAFGMNILVYNRTIYHELEQDTLHFADLETVLKSSDFISLHCPLTPETKELINEDTLSMMKDGAYLINTARGGLIVESHVQSALIHGKLGCYATDTITLEPISSDNPLRKAPNVLITPHIAWASKETLEHFMELVLHNFTSYMEGNPINIVNL